MRNWHPAASDPLRRSAESRPRSPAPNICSRAASDAGEPSSSRPRRKNGSAAIQFHGFPPIIHTCAGPPAKPSQEKPQTTIDNGSNRDRAQRCQHGVRSTARAAEAIIDQRQAGHGQRHQKNGEETNRPGRSLGKRGPGNGNHRASSFECKWERNRRNSPINSTAVPATTKAISAGADRRRSSADRTIPHPASRR